MKMKNEQSYYIDEGKAKSGVSRWQAALGNSINGLKFGFKSEAAIREEVIVLVASIPAAIYLVESVWVRLAMILSVLFVLIIEVLNSAIEATLDRVSKEHNLLTKAAKDLGSLAVLLAMIFAVSIWVVAVLMA
ncbi:Diacylglycerol kinase [gamma proteobacterium IMCC2047]|nr:Diacylglycerol kinase [gamma proteobacterium IMCC2047]